MATTGEDLARNYVVDFDEADKNGDGVLDARECIAIMRKNGYRGEDVDAMEMFRHVNKNLDDKVTRDEYINCLKAVPKLTMEEWVLRYAFQRMDGNKDGTLSREEVEKATERCGADPKAVKKVLEHMDKNKVEKIDYEVFLTVQGLEKQATILYQIFNQMDENNDGFLSVDEIDEASNRAMQLKMDWDCFFKLRDSATSEGKIAYKAFVDLWLSESTIETFRMTIE